MKMVFGKGQDRFALNKACCANSNAGTICDECDEQKKSTKEYPDHDNEDTVWLCDECFETMETDNA